MKTIFTVSTCGEIQNACFTNLKALYNFLTSKSGLDSENTDMSVLEEIGKTTSFNYSNLVKEVRRNQKTNRMTVAIIGDDIEVCELGICKNWQ